MTRRADAVNSHGHANVPSCGATAGPLDFPTKQTAPLGGGEGPLEVLVSLERPPGCVGAT